MSSQQPPSSSPKTEKREIKNILIGCTGSVAAIKIPILVKKLMEIENFNVKLVTTERSRHFFTSGDIGEVDLITDADEWSAWKARGDPVLHIELSKWADLFLIAPLDANTLGKLAGVGILKKNNFVWMPTLGKLAGGICDNLLTCIARAWNINKPLFFCPAMNTKMYEHPITSVHISTLLGWGYIEIPVISKVLVCGDKGLGAMAEVDTIVRAVVDSLNSS